MDDAVGAYVAAILAPAFVTHQVPPNRKTPDGRRRCRGSDPHREPRLRRPRSPRHPPAGTASIGDALGRALQVLHHLRGPSVGPAPARRAKHSPPARARHTPRRCRPVDRGSSGLSVHSRRSHSPAARLPHPAGKKDCGKCIGRWRPARRVALEDIQSPRATMFSRSSVQENPGGGAALIGFKR